MSALLPSDSTPLPVQKNYTTKVQSVGAFDIKMSNKQRENVNILISGTTKTPTDEGWVSVHCLRITQVHRTLSESYQNC